VSGDALTLTLVRLGDQRFFIASRDVPLGCHLAYEPSLLTRMNHRESTEADVPY
jgi:hypothetical protein